MTNNILSRPAGVLCEPRTIFDPALTLLYLNQIPILFSRGAAETAYFFSLEQTSKLDMFPFFCGKFTLRASCLELPSTGLFLFVDTECTGLCNHVITRHGRDLIKGQLLSPIIPQCSTTHTTQNLQHHIRLQLSLTMRFSNLLVPFVSAIALASNVAASATPERRGSPPTQSCSTGDLTCCVSSAPFSSLSSATQSSLLGLVNPNLLLNLPVGLDCVVPGLLGWYCTPRFLYSI